MAAVSCERMQLWTWPSARFREAGLPKITTKRYVDVLSVGVVRSFRPVEWSCKNIAGAGRNRNVNSEGCELSTSNYSFTRST